MRTLIVLGLVAACGSREPSPAEHRRKVVAMANSQYASSGVQLEIVNADSTELRTSVPCNAVDAGIMRAISGKSFSTLECKVDGTVTKRDLTKPAPPPTPSTKTASGVNMDGFPCSSRDEDVRYAWIAAPSRFLDPGETPHDAGLRVEGECSRKLRSKDLRCDLASQQSIWGDDGLMGDAITKGFTTLVCEEISSGKTNEYPLADIAKGK